MNSTGTELIDAVKMFINPEWYRHAGFGWVGENSNTIFVVWRFAAEDAEGPIAKNVIETLHQVVKNFSGNVSWALRFQGRNWVLAPAMLFEVEDSKKFRTDLEVLNYLQALDSDLGKKATEDIAVIAARFKQAMLV